MGNMKALGYTRVSTQEQSRGGISLEAQAQMLADYAQLHRFELVHVLVDAGVSGGKPLGTRPQGRILLNRIADGDATMVIAIKLDRLFRSASDCLSVVQDWDQTGIGLHLVSQGGTSVDTQSAMGRFLLTIMSGVAEMERNLTKERVREVLQYKQERGERTGTVPYGFRLGLGGKLLEADPEEQRVIQHIVDARARSRSYQAIANDLNARGVPARGKRWHKTSIVRLLARGDWRPELQVEEER